jgi:hypothetical protein
MDRVVTLAILMATNPSIEDDVRPRLETLGFRRRRGGVFTIAVGPGIFGWLGLNRGTKHLARGEVEINPVVGVRFEEVERLFELCLPEDPDKHVTPTISSPLGYLLPEKRFTTWLLSHGDNSVASATMVRAITEYGLPFMRSVPDLRTLRQKMDARTGIEDVLVYKRPVAAYLDGDRESARELLDRSVAALGVRTDPAAEHFKEFARRLRERLAAKQ